MTGCFQALRDRPRSIADRFGAGDRPIRTWPRRAGSRSGAAFRNKARFTDPNGLTTGTLSEQGSVQNVQGTLSNTAQSTFRYHLKRVLSQADAIRSQVCKGKCSFRVPVLLHRIEMPETTKHVLDSIIGFGNTIGNPTPSRGLTLDNYQGPWVRSILPLFKRRRGSHRRGWYNLQPQCNPIARFNYWLPPGVCDEFPFASTEEGGRQGYLAGQVSIRLTPFYEGIIQGHAIRRFYRNCDIDPDNVIKRYFVVGVTYRFTYSECGPN